MTNSDEKWASYHSQVGKTLGDRYQVKSVLGRGGMATVYQATQQPMDRDVAIKVLSPHSARDDTCYARFEREMRVVSQLTHPNCITVFDYGRTDEGLPFLVMEYLDGRRLNDVVKLEAPLSLSRTVHIITQICDALAEAHDKQIVHRDLKTSNILLIRQHGHPDFVKVLDFGLAKVPSYDGESALTEVGMVVGTPSYMSPEQIKGASLDQRSDLYSLGIILYELLTGVQPFTADNPMALMVMHVENPVPRISEVAPEVSVPAGVDAFIAKALAKKSEYRYANADVFKSELLKLLGADATGAFPAPGRERTDPQFKLRQLQQQQQDDLEDSNPTLQSLQILEPPEFDGGQPASVQPAATPVTYGEETVPDARLADLMEAPQTAGAALDARTATEPDSMATQALPQPEVEAPLAAKKTTAPQFATAEVAAGAEGAATTSPEFDAVATDPAANEEGPVTADVALPEPADEAAAAPVADGSENETVALPSPMAAGAAQPAEGEVPAQGPPPGVDPEHWSMTSAEFNFFDEEDESRADTAPVKRPGRGVVPLLIAAAVAACAVVVIIGYMVVSWSKPARERLAAVEAAAGDGEVDPEAVKAASELVGGLLGEEAADELGLEVGATEGDGEGEGDTDPEQPDAPELPDQPEQPDAPEQPDQPEQPDEPEQPAKPEPVEKPAPEPKPDQPKETVTAKKNEPPEQPVEEPRGDPTKLISEGTRALKAGNYKKALAKLEPALSMDPNNATVLAAIGEAHFNQGRTQTAVKYYKRAESRAPRKAKVHLLLGLAYHEMGRLKQARDHYEKYVQLAPNGSEAEAVRGILQSL